MSSREISEWQALYRVKNEEAAERRLAAESSDGEVVTDFGAGDEDDEDDNEANDDGREPE